MELERIKGWGIGCSVPLGLLIVLCLIPFPGSTFINSRTTSAKNDVIMLSDAIKNFRSEYGHFPKITEDVLSETTAANAQLIEILEGRNEEDNPRNIRFIEIPKAHEWEGRFRSGIDPNTGAWNDPWGNFYRIRIATDSDALKSPHLDDKTHPESSVLVWSLGKDGIQGTSVKSDDVTSWR